MDIDGKRPSKLPEADLDSFRKSAQAAGDALATWIDYAKGKLLVFLYRSI